MVLELLASSVEMDRADEEILEWMGSYGSKPEQQWGLQIKTSANPSEFKTIFTFVTTNDAYSVTNVLKHAEMTLNLNFCNRYCRTRFDSHISTEF